MVIPHVTEILPHWTARQPETNTRPGDAPPEQRDLVAASLLLEGTCRDVYPSRPGGYRSSE